MPKSSSSRRLFRSLPLLAGALLLLGAGCAKQTRSAAAREAEAEELYKRADLYVRHINEGAYSYEYIDFHYLHAMKNIDRILTAYADTAEAGKIKAGDLKLGPYGIDYFRDTLLVQLGDMKEATESVVNAAIYLRTLPEAGRAPARGALALILETLCRQVRTNEALIFPVLPEDRTFADATIVRVLARGDQQGMALSLVQGSPPEEQMALAAAYGEGLASGGEKNDALTEFAARFPTPEHTVEEGVFLGMVDREGVIYRGTYDKIRRKREEDARQAALAAGHEPAAPAEAPVRYDLAAYYRDALGSRPSDAAAAAYAGIVALQGRFDEARTIAAGHGEDALVAAVVGAYENLSLNGRLTGTETLARQAGLGAEGVARCEMKQIEFLEAGAQHAAADALTQAALAEFPAEHDQIIRRRMYGIFYGREELFYLEPTTITSLDIKDPAVCAEVMLDWLLSQNRLQRGSSWGADQILFKYFSMQKEGRVVSRKLIKVR